MIQRPSKIICVGRNYGAHAAELGNVVPERPLDVNTEEDYRAFVSRARARPGA